MTALAIALGTYLAAKRLWTNSWICGQTTCCIGIRGTANEFQPRRYGSSKKTCCNNIAKEEDPVTKKIKLEGAPDILDVLDNLVGDEQDSQQIRMGVSKSGDVVDLEYKIKVENLD